jgi:hypothetical protein
MCYHGTKSLQRLVYNSNKLLSVSDMAMLALSQWYDIAGLVKQPLAMYRKGGLAFY